MRSTQILQPMSNGFTPGPRAALAHPTPRGRGATPMRGSAQTIAQAKALLVRLIATSLPSCLGALTANAQVPPEASASAPPPAASSAHANARLVSESPLGQCVRRPPRYPVEALRKALSGQSVVAFTVAADGALENPALLRSSGHAVLDSAALAHLGRCIAHFRLAEQPPLPAGRYALPILWRVE